MEQAGGTLGHVLDQHLPAAVQQQAVQRRLVFVLCDGSARLLSPTGSRGEDIDSVPCRVLEQEPVHDTLAQAAGDCGEIGRGEGASHHPPASASALWYACVTATSSSPLSDILGAQGLRSAAAGRGVQQPPAKCCSVWQSRAVVASRARSGPVLRGQLELLVLLRNPGTCGPAASQAAVRRAIGSSLYGDAGRRAARCNGSWERERSTANSPGLQQARLRERKLLHCCTAQCFRFQISARRESHKGTGISSPAGPSAPLCFRRSSRLCCIVCCSTSPSLEWTGQTAVRMSRAATTARFLQRAGVVLESRQLLAR